MKDHAAPVNARPPDFAALAERIEERLGLGAAARRWAGWRGLDPERLAGAGWRSAEADGAWAALRSALESCGAALPAQARRARAVLLIPACDPDGRPVSVRVRPLDPPGKTLSLPGSTATPCGADSLGAPGEVIHVCEGEADRESLIEAGALCAIGLPGASTCHGWLCEHLPGTGPRRVALWFDGDEAGRKAAEALARKLVAGGLTVRRATLPPGEDVNDRWRADPDGLRAAVRFMEASE